MKLTLLAKDSGSGKDGCPSIYRIDDAPDECVVQGPLLEARQTSSMTNVLPGEAGVRIRVQVLRDFLDQLG